MGLKTNVREQSVITWVTFKAGFLFIITHINMSDWAIPSF